MRSRAERDYSRANPNSRKRIYISAVPVITEHMLNIGRQAPSRAAEAPASQEPNIDVKDKPKPERRLKFGIARARLVMPEVPDAVAERAYDLYRRWTEVRPDTSVNHSTAETKAIACLFRAAREHGMDQSLSAMGTRGAWSPVFRAYNMLRRDLELPLILAKPENIIKDITSSLQSSPDVLELALDIAHAANGIGMLNSMTARVIAAVSVHLASIKVNEPLTRKEVARTAGVSEGALHTGIISFRTRAEREIMHNGPNAKAARLLI